MKKIFKNLKVKKKGFTLIEMIIVIVIIGILAAAILPKILGARDRATDVAIKADLRNIATALEMYYMDNGTYTVEGGGWKGKGKGRVTFDSKKNPDTMWGNNYPKSTISILTEGGYLNDQLKAVGPKNNLGITDYALYTCNDGQSYSLSARLYNSTEDDITYIQTVCNGIGPNGIYNKIGMNYAIAGGR